MKKLILLVFILLGFKAIAQNPEIKTDLPTIIPPSPTVAALMKFEEVPVSNYTGVPDVSIPLFSSPTLSKDISLDISLKYHSGVGANDRASDVGLGWSLFAGGTISRTVRGLPDEQLVLDGGSSAGKVGLYHTSINNHNNYYYQHGADFSTFVYNEPYKANEYVWDIVERGKFDTEHDLWQFNFMGQSGRFYIEKDITTNILRIVPLSDFRVKIINNYVTTTQNKYVPISFTIYDELGFRYEFDVIETTKNSTAIRNEFFGNTNEQTSISAERDFNSAFHLTKIIDPNNNLLVEYIFNNNISIRECTTNSACTINDYFALREINPTELDVILKEVNCFNEIKPIKSIVNSISDITVKKIQSINISSKSKIDLVYEKGIRIDTNIQNIEDASALKSITIKDWNNNIVKKYNLFYSNSTVLDTRMLLDKIEEVGGTNTVSYYDFYYETNSSSGNNVGKDYWGYFNLSPSCDDKDITFENEPTPSFSTTDVLQKIKYPTGGCAVFNYEANRYSYIGDVALTNFNENPHNFSLTATSTLTFSNTTHNENTGTNNAGIQLLNYSATDSKKVKIYSHLEYPEDIIEASKSFKLVKLVGSDWVTVLNLTCAFGRSGCCSDYTLLQGVQYGIQREIYVHPYLGANDAVTIEYFTKNVVEKKYLYGGGNRIKQIGYFDVDVSENYYKSTPNNIFPKKEKLFSYTLPTDVNKSSGSLVFGKPIFKYQSLIKLKTNCFVTLYIGSFAVHVPYIFHDNLHFITTSNFNNLISIKTQGADVGYKYVTVTENGNGRTHYEYTSPIDYPEEFLSINRPPFLPSKNIDFKRGLLLSEAKENQSFLKLLDIKYEYDLLQTERTYGIRRYKPSGVCFEGPYFNNFLYSTYLSFYESTQFAIYISSSPSNFLTLNLCGYPIDYTQQYFLIEAYGWAKLKSKTTQSYFYPTGSTTPNIVQTDETYDYNPINKKISESTLKNSFGEIMKTKYFYLTTVDTPNSKNNISTIERIETYKNNDLLSTSKIEYSTAFAGNVSYLPQTILTSKGTQTLESRLKYNAYDEYGHPLEVQQQNGTVVSYIWGYNKTQPIAKIENATYDEVQPYVGNLQDLSNSTNEANLITALNALRTALPNAMITTYTYKPLIGISMVTDPKGDKQTYHYDEFNRLQFVKDSEDNILSENAYHYRTPN